MTFGVFCDLLKASDSAFDLWAGVLSRLPTSRLLLIGSGVAACREQIKGRFTARGIALQRIEMKDRMDTEQYLRIHDSVDVLLDSFPYAGESTNFNAMWMGVPVVTLSAELPASRSGSIVQKILGLEDLIASSSLEYVNLAERLARNPERMNVLRRSLRTRMAESILVDGAGFTRNLEDAYLQMWQTWCDSK